MKKYIILLLTLSLVSCINDDDYNIPDLECPETSLIKTIEPQDIVATGNIQEYTANDIIEAYVTSSDESGNFYKTISFQSADGLFGFSTSVDATSTFVSYEPGRKVLIKLENTYYRNYNGSLQIGNLSVYNGFATITGFSAYEYTSILNRSCTVIDEDAMVQHTSITELQDDTYLNRFVEIENIQFTDGAIGQPFYDADNDIGGGTNYLLTDETGNTLVFRTSSFATFGGNIIPQKSGKVRGILSKYGTTYQFMIRTIEDLKLTEERF